jgi:hypothetical protein
VLRGGDSAIIKVPLSTIQHRRPSPPRLASREQGHMAGMLAAGSMQAAYRPVGRAAAPAPRVAASRPSVASVQLPGRAMALRVAQPRVRFVAARAGEGDGYTSAEDEDVVSGKLKAPSKMSVGELRAEVRACVRQFASRRPTARSHAACACAPPVQRRHAERAACALFARSVRRTACARRALLRAAVRRERTAASQTRVSRACATPAALRS